MFKTTSSYTTTLEAHIISGRLNAEGIPNTLVNEHHILANWALSIALGGVGIQVPSNYFKQAKDVIAGIEANQFRLKVPKEVAKSDMYYCPECQSGTTSSGNLSWRLAFIIIFMFHIPLPFSHYVMKCDTCEHKWLDTKQRPYPLYVVGFAIFLSVLITSILSVVIGSLLLLACQPSY